MKGSKPTYKQIKAALQKQKQIKQNSKAKSKGLSSAPLCCYKFIKLIICVSIVLIASLSLLIALGSTATNQHPKIFQLFQNDHQYAQNQNALQTLLKQKTSNLYQNVINLHLANRNANNHHNSLKDLNLFAKFALQQIDSSIQVASLPLRVECYEWCGVVNEQISAKILKQFKLYLKKLLNYLNLKQLIKQSQKKKEVQKQCIFSTLKDLLIKGKFSKIKDILISQTWNFVNQNDNYILYWNDNISSIQQKKQILKNFKKWIKEHEQSTIFITSTDSVNEAIGSQLLKTYQVTAGFQTISNEALQNYLPFWEQSQINILRKRIYSCVQLNQFLGFVNSRTKLETDLKKQQQKIVQNVCELNHYTFYFYDKQEQTQLVMKKSEVQSQSRWERQLQAFQIKLSILKNSLGLSYLQDVYETLSSTSSSLNSLNNQGLHYNFANHELTWKQNFDKLWFQIKNKRQCGQSDYLPQIQQQQELPTASQVQLQQNQQFNSQEQETQANLQDIQSFKQTIQIQAEQINQKLIESHEQKNQQNSIQNSQEVPEQQNQEHAHQLNLENNENQQQSIQNNQQALQIQQTPQLQNQHDEKGDQSQHIVDENVNQVQNSQQETEDLGEEITQDDKETTQKDQSNVV